MAKILIIDDDQAILRLLEFTLRRAGHQVFIAEDGVAGLAVAEADQPDLIVVDVMMPKMNGYEFCRKARARPDLAETPIVMFSARYHSIDKETAQEVGATAYLSKTTSPNDLLKRLGELLPAKESLIQHTAISLFSLRGGSGSTSLAVNLAVAIARQTNKSTLLVDLARLGGHTALMLGLSPNSSVAQALATSKNSVTPDALKPHIYEHESGLHLLASGHSYDQELRLTNKRLDSLLTTLKSSYTYTILDLPHILEPNFASSLQQFDKIIVPISPDMPSIQSATMALQGLVRLGIPENKIVLVVNHTLPTGALSSDTIQKITKRTILAHIPYEPEMIKAVNNGRPLLLGHPEAPGAMAIAKLAEILLV